MKEHSKLNERRILQRFPVKNGALAFNAKICGQIINISLEGLSFQYIDQQSADQQILTNSKEPRSESKTLDIVFGDYNFTLNDIPITLISDHEMSVSHPYRSTAAKRRRCVQFEKLNPEQLFRLKRFILINRYGLVPIGTHNAELFRPPSKSYQNTVSHNG